ncbi:MAG: UMP kinase, partial [Betaproteobacteria bacterium]|nr:UMP kinase [Betaproteobacteria bacterium]
MPAKPQRIVLKLSGEALLGSEPGDNFSVESLQHLVEEISSVKKLGIEMALIFGGGNIVRGSAYSKISGTSRVQGDYMGMLATVINAMAMQGALQASGIETRLHTAVEMDQLAQLYIR